MPIPTEPELRQILTALLAHAISPKADRQRCAITFLFEETIRRGKLRTPIQGADIIAHCPGKAEARDPETAARGLIRDIKRKLTAFFNNHEEAYTLPYSVTFEGDGNYSLSFEPMKPRPQTDDLVPIFWQPHFPGRSASKALILIPEPQFFVDEKQTYFRNPSANTLADKGVFDYLTIPGTLETSYSFVPAGIVQAMLHLVPTLRYYEREQWTFPAVKSVKPSITMPPEQDNLIVLTTPTSTKALVETLEAGMPMHTTAQGVSYGANLYQDTSTPHVKSVVMVKWGVLTRKPQRLRTVTLLAAKHGRMVEAMMQFLTLHSQLVALAQKLQRVSGFPECFQALFRARMVKTPEGPFTEETRVEKVIIPDLEDAAQD